ncbi:hypothetical protein [Actinophytocola sp.]|uniref:hypothetical protein n=1 Tax=Actinophytocola sp. TaxID=1872138 RepID=UPI002ED1A930
MHTVEIERGQHIGQPAAWSAASRMGADRTLPPDSPSRSTAWTGCCSASAAIPHDRSCLPSRAGTSGAPSAGQAVLLGHPAVDVALSAVDGQLDKLMNHG